jgi:hypothetical protein
MAATATAAETTLSLFNFLERFGIELIFMIPPVGIQLIIC